MLWMWFSTVIIAVNINSVSSEKTSNNLWIRAAVKKAMRKLLDSIKQETKHSVICN